MLADQITGIAGKLGGIEEKVSETRESVASLKTKIDLYLGNGKDGESRNSSRSKSSRQILLLLRGVYAGVIAALVSTIVTFAIVPLPITGCQRALRRRR